MGRKRKVVEKKAGEGGDASKLKHSVPIGVNVVEYAETRALEMKTMAEAIRSGGSGRKRAFQTLPRHMRRRTMSHNAKRLPKRLQSRAKQEMNVDETASKKSRRSRRRSKWIRSEFEGRNSREGKKWLETHLWHAKRMKMGDEYGFRLAQTSSSKWVRKTYRSIRERCLMHDMSYYGCVELAGNRSVIITGLRPMVADQKLGIDVLEGRCEGAYLFYKKDSSNLIGPCQLLWRPDSLLDSSQVWLWFHPGCFLEALQEMQSAFSGSDVTVTSLENQLIRFRLLGLKSWEIARNALAADGDDELLKKIWRSAVIPAKLAIGLNVFDPRIVSAEKKLHAETTAEENILLQDFKQIPVSNIWSSESRAKASKEKIPNHEADATKSHPGAKIQSIPIMIIQQHSPRFDLASGIDVVVPSGWGMPFWMAFLLGGATPAAQSAMEQLNVESETLTFPRDYPDTKAGKEWAVRKRDDEVKKYFLLPPAKRSNFAALGIKTPFHANWEEISGEMNKGPFPCVARKRDLSSLSLEGVFLPVSFEMLSGVASWLDLIALPSEEDRKKLKADPRFVGPQETVVGHRRLTAVDEFRVGVFSGVLSRDVIGHVTSADYRFSRGRGAGVGLCLASVILESAKTDRPLLLVRSRDSNQYRLAKFKLFF